MSAAEEEENVGVMVAADVGFSERFSASAAAERKGAKWGLLAVAAAGTLVISTLSTVAALP